METITKDPKPRKAPAGETEAGPLHVVREGAIAASIWRRQAPSGFAYYDFTLSRSWKSLSSGKAGYSKSFFDANREDLIRVITQALTWIDDQRKASGEAPPEPTLLVA
jgi:hypothetical protein